MRVFNWRQCLTENRIPFIEKGANVKSGELAVKCPFCGSADPSFHMGLSLETGFWSCWRNRAQHSGKSPLRLLMKLLRVPYGRARELAGLGDDYVDPEGFDAMAAKLMGRDRSTGSQAVAQRRVLRLDESFTIIEPRGHTRRCYEYLAFDRGFTGFCDVERLGAHYGICAGGAKFAGRVVLPYYQDGQLVTWTGRAIGESTMRYRDLEREESILPPKQTLFNHDCMLKGGRVLLVQEGPFDALKVDFYGKRYGVRSVGLSTNSVTNEQAFLLQTAVGKFDRVLLMMDQNASGLGIVDSMRMKQTLAFLPGLGVAKVPFGKKDGAELTPTEITEWAEALVSGDI